MEEKLVLNALTISFESFATKEEARMSFIKARLIAHALKKQESSEMLDLLVNHLRVERPLGYEDFQ